MSSSHWPIFKKLYPDLRSAECATQDLLLSWFQSWEGINDESCLAEHPAGERGCVR